MVVSGSIDDVSDVVLLTTGDSVTESISEELDPSNAGRGSPVMVNVSDVTTSEVIGKYVEEGMGESLVEFKATMALESD